MAKVAAVASSLPSSAAATASSFRPSDSRPGFMGRQSDFTSSCFASSAAAFVASLDSSSEQKIVDLV
jgi:hypothetical protein